MWMQFLDNLHSNTYLIRLYSNRCLSNTSLHFALHCSALLCMPAQCLIHSKNTLRNAISSTKAEWKPTKLLAGNAFVVHGANQKNRQFFLKLKFTSVEKKTRQNTDDQAKASLINIKISGDDRIYVGLYFHINAYIFFLCVLLLVVIISVGFAMRRRPLNK